MRIVLLGSALMLGCIPFPHHERDTPAIHGTLSEAGRPLAGVKVSLTSDPVAPANCDAPRATVVTDEGGRFEIPPAESFHFFAVFGDRAYGWGLCFERPNGLRASTRGGGGLWIPGAVTVSCELDGGSSEAHCISKERTDVEAAK